jgi:lysophospholipase L1-like esterase
VSVPLRRSLLLFASLTPAVAACAHDGPPIVSGAASLGATEQAEVAVLAEAVTVDEELGADDDALQTSATPTSDPTEGADGDLNGGDGTGQGLGASDVPRPLPGTVAVVGDSIARSAEPFLRPAFDALDIEVVAYDAVESRRMVNGGGSLPSGQTAIRDIVASGEQPDLWVVALGTNDVGAATGREAWARAIDELMAEIPDGADVIWVDTWLQRLDPAAVEFNDTLRDELRRHDDTLVLDWHTRAATEGLIIEDGVHLSETGKIEFARLVAEALRTTYD